MARDAHLESGPRQLAAAGGSWRSTKKRLPPYLCLPLDPYPICLSSHYWRVLAHPLTHRELDFSTAGSDFAIQQSVLEHYCRVFEDPYPVEWRLRNCSRPGALTSAGVSKSTHTWRPRTQSALRRLRSSKQTFDPTNLSPRLGTQGREYIHGASVGCFR